MLPEAEEGLYSGASNLLRNHVSTNKTVGEAAALPKCKRE